MNAREQKAAAKVFAEKWAGRGNEKSETQFFWRSLLHDIYGMENVDDILQFEVPVKIKHTVAEGEQTTTRFIDVMIPFTHIVIEQKSYGIDLKKPASQSGGDNLTAFEQAKRYADFLPAGQHPRWIITCNFAEFHIHDMEKPTEKPQIVLLENLPQEYDRLRFLIDKGDMPKLPEEKISFTAGDIVKRLKDALKKQYIDPESRQAKESLNKLCVRLVFCLYAEDAGVFDIHNMFHDYLKSFHPQNVRLALIELFKALATPDEKRDPYMNERLAAFPYVNGGLFEDESIEIPNFNEEILDILLNHASADFDWSQISPPIFGALFESTLSNDVRRTGGMHYTSIENIHKVIDPLFLNDLKAEFKKIKEYKRPKNKHQKLLEFQKKLASLIFLDPAAGSGNFLTETYLSLRRLENEVLYLIHHGNLVMGELDDPIKVSIKQFYGIEINDYAVAVAQTALWIAESQMLKETEQVLGKEINFLPLKSNPNIIEGNALTMDWSEVVPKDKLNYIMGNPPFVGGMMMSREQKAQMNAVWGDVNGIGELDYVSAWYKKAFDYINGTDIRATFVSTNSITQGQQAVTMWKPLMKEGLWIDFAYTTFQWNSESSQTAAVHCVIIGFSCRQKTCYIFTDEGMHQVDFINSYLIDAPQIFVESRSNPLCNVPPMRFGNMPRDGGGFILTDEEKADFIKENPSSEKWIRLYLGAREFINRKNRWCLWLVDANPSEIKKCNLVMERIARVRNFRLNSKADATRNFAKTPSLFCQIAQPDTNYIAVPEVSSENREYIPIGFLDASIIASNKLFMLPNATLYHFGILTSKVHMAWMRVVCGRLEMRYSYSKDIVYNNFPWPYPTDAQKQTIEQTAQAILDARAKFPDANLADLYDKNTMPPELIKAHQANDKAVITAYGFKPNMEEAEIVAKLFEMYQILTK